jgi:hypothetical protein
LFSGPQIKGPFILGATGERAVHMTIYSKETVRFLLHGIGMMGAVCIVILYVLGFMGVVLGPFVW